MPQASTLTMLLEAAQQEPVEQEDEPCVPQNPAGVSILAMAAL